MGMTINRKTKGKATLTKPIINILKGWRADFNSFENVSKCELTGDVLHERDFYNRVIKSNDINILDIYFLNQLAESKTISASLITGLFNIPKNSSAEKLFSDSMNAIAAEAETVKNFINKHYEIHLY